MAKFELFFNDLKTEAQTRLLEAFTTSESEENWDAFPLAVIEREFEPDTQ